MSVASGPQGIVSVESGQWLTLTGCKRVLVVVRTEVYGQRLRDLLSLLESDLRIQVAFTMAPHAFNRGAERSLPDRLGSVLPWEEAVRTDFDLALAAGTQGTERLRASLIRLPHGAGHMKLSRLDDDRDPGAPRTVGGLGRRYLMRNGTVVPRVLALAHREDLDVLADTCPEALPAAEVVGDAVAPLDDDRCLLWLRGGHLLEAHAVRPWGTPRPHLDGRPAPRLRREPVVARRPEPRSGPEVGLLGPRRPHR